MAIAAFGACAFLSPVYAYNYGVGVYGSGAYNVGEQIPTTITLTSSANPATEGESVAFRATVSSSTATGTITFKEGANTIGTGHLRAGSGFFVTSNLRGGTAFITAVYGGNDNYAASTSQSVTQVAQGVSSSAPTGGGGGTGGGRGRSGLPRRGSSVSSSASSSPGTGSTEPPSRGMATAFSDVPPAAWFSSYVTILFRDGIISGYKDARGKLTGEFKPENPVTEAEILKIALLAAGKTIGEGIPENSSAQGDWSASYVYMAEQLRLSLNIHRPATRREGIQTILEAFGVPIERSENPFSDLRASSPYAKAFETAYVLGIISGDTDAEGNRTGTVRPGDPINRAEVAKIVVLARQLLRK